MKVVAAEKLADFVAELFVIYFDIVERRMMIDKRAHDNALVVKALDRFYRRLENIQTFEEISQV